MVESDHEIALEDTDRIHGRAALVNNVKAATSLAGAVRSTLGPMGLDKMLVGSDGSSIVTNDGVTVLEAAQVEHPTARLLIEASSSQDRSSRDGTTTTVILISEMLQNALELVRMGVHPSIIINGYNIALKEAISEIERVSLEAGNDEKEMVVRTSLQGKSDSALCELLASLAIRAANSISDEDGGEDLERFLIKRLEIRKGDVMETCLEDGLVMMKSRVDPVTPSKSNGGLVALIDGGLENRKFEFSASIEISSPELIKEFHDEGLSNLERRISHLSSLGVDLLVVREGIADEAFSLLSKAGITAYRRFERRDLELLAKITGAKISRDPLKISKDDLGDYSGRREESIAGVKHTVFEGSTGIGKTLLARGSSPMIREESIRIFDDALGVAHRLNSDSRILPGGGAIHTHLARFIRKLSLSQSGREQLAMDAFSASMEAIPRILAENAGRDPVDVILSLSADQKEGGEWVGFDLEKGRNCDMRESGILDPMFVVKSSISGATEAAISVIRIDDVLWAKTDPLTPDWKDEEEVGG